MKEFCFFAGTLLLIMAALSVSHTVAILCALLGIILIAASSGFGDRAVQS